MRLSDEEFRLISQLMYSRFGIHLTEQKRTLITERLQKTMLAGNFSSFKAYYDYVMADTSNQALLDLADRLSTNHTYFFREKDHFAFLADTLLPELTAAARRTGRRVLRLWSAGCSSGEEVYTLAMVIHEYLGHELPRWDVGILGTDISVSALSKANAGVYSAEQTAHLPAGYKERYFKAGPAGTWSVCGELRQLVLFRRLNLMNTAYPFKGTFQGIFCRNVMIYFDEPTRHALLDRFCKYLEPGGHLFIGHSESIERSNRLLGYVRPAVYKKR